MLNEYNAGATLPVQDMERARDFWENKVGMKPVRELPAGVIYSSGGADFLVFPSGGKASGDHTQMSFRVKDVEAEVTDLRSRGVQFEEYDGPDLKTENGIATFPHGRAAWFKDTEGNVVGIIEMDESD